MIEQSKKNTAVGKRAIPQVILNDKECYCITTMYFQCTVNQTRKYLATVQCLLSSLEIVLPRTILIVCHIHVAYSSQ